jgi:hypothetical protein
MRTATIVDVLYADDCVIFTNTIAAIQIMIVVFDDVVKLLFGMELAIHKTKIVCNQYSKVMEREAQELAGEIAATASASMHNMRGRRALARIRLCTYQ